MKNFAYVPQATEGIQVDVMAQIWAWLDHGGFHEGGFFRPQKHYLLNANDLRTCWNDRRCDRAWRSDPYLANKTVRVSRIVRRLHSDNAVRCHMMPNFTRAWCHDPDKKQLGNKFDGTIFMAMAKVIDSHGNDVDEEEYPLGIMAHHDYRVHIIYPSDMIVALSAEELYPVRLDDGSPLIQSQEDGGVNASLVSTLLYVVLANTVAFVIIGGYCLRLLLQMITHQHGNGHESSSKGNMLYALAPSSPVAV